MLELELWGGHECTVLRAGDAVVDQNERSGHVGRPSDLERFAALGVRALRYPVLWEHVSREHPEARDWTFPDQSLGRLRELGVRPIVGLVHHGSGPAYTGLLDEGFAAGLGRHARSVAERYPWVEEWCPVNEPLTTARFSALYGHWQPHARDEASFWRALVNEVDAVRASMAAIREVVPHARLVQTDDLGRTFSTPALAYQADFDNERRWLSWDLLCGRVDRTHPLWLHLEGAGLGDRLRAIADAPCPPDVIGINHYLTSDRFLDERLDRYPERTWGGNDRQRYADVEAVRVCVPGVPGFYGAILEAWDRYGLPVALTEVHNGSTREEQMRWMAEAWRSAERARAEGIDVRGVTAWSLLGAYDWDSLLTRAAGHYERGVFDLAAGELRDTAMVPLLRALSARKPLHPAAEERGWWHRPMRLQFPAEPVDVRPSPLRSHDPTRPRLALVGDARWTRDVARRCRLRGLAYHRRQRWSDAALERAWGVIVWEGSESARASRACSDRGIPCVVLSPGRELDAALDELLDREWSLLVDESTASAS